MIDLHTHTTASDGTFKPSQLVSAAGEIGLEALAITDHDNFLGYDEATLAAGENGLDLVCGIELSTRMPRTASHHGKSVHILGYFLDEPPSDSFRAWLNQIQDARRDRNRRLIERLRELGVPITLEEVQEVGRNMTGRPHFAKVLVEKGYVTNYQEAFDLYLDESARAYVQRLEPSVPEGIWRIRSGNGIAVLAHPVRLNVREPGEEDRLIRWMCDQGLQGIEVYHTDHGPEHELHYLALAEKYGLAVTGGSDFHGDLKPRVKLGTGKGNLAIPREVLERLRDSVRA